jgi:hypothetical protein
LPIPVQFRIIFFKICYLHNIFTHHSFLVYFVLNFTFNFSWHFILNITLINILYLEFILWQSEIEGLYSFMLSDMNCNIVWGSRYQWEGEDIRKGVGGWICANIMCTCM